MYIRFFLFWHRWPRGGLGQDPGPRRPWEGEAALRGEVRVGTWDPGSPGGGQAGGGRKRARRAVGVWHLQHVEGLLHTDKINYDQMLYTIRYGTM